MHVIAAERPEVLQTRPVETAPSSRDSRLSHVFNTIMSGAIGRPYIPPSNPEDPSLRQTFDELIRQNFGQESKARNYFTQVGKVKDVGYLAITKWQNRDVSSDRIKSWMDKRPGLRRTATLLGSMAAVTTIWTLASRTAQAYAMSRHGMDLHYLDTPHATPSLADSGHDTVSADQASPPVPGETMVLASQESVDTVHHNAVHHYGGIRVEAADYTTTNRIAESWATDKDCAWNWARQDLAVAGHRAGLSDAQIRAVVHNDTLVDRVTDRYISSNNSIRNAPNNWLYEGKTYNAHAGRTEADQIIHERFPHTSTPEPEHPPAEPVPDKPHTEQPPTSDPDLKDTAGDIKDDAEKASKGFAGYWDRYVDGPWNDFVETVGHETKAAWKEWQDNRWVRLIVGAGTLAAYGVHEMRKNRRSDRSRPLDPLYPTGPSPFNLHHTARPRIPPLTNRGRVRHGLSDLKQRATTSGFASRARQRWSDRRGASASSKDPAGKP